MIPMPSGVRISGLLLATLTCAVALVQESLKRDPHGGGDGIFRGRRVSSRSAS